MSHTATKNISVYKFTHAFTRLIAEPQAMIKFTYVKKTLSHLSQENTKPEVKGKTI